MCQTRFFHDDSSYFKFLLNNNFLVKDQRFHFIIIFDSILSFIYSHVAILNQASIGIYANVGKLLKTTPNLHQASRPFLRVNNHDP
jgi:hypothetical protein